VFGALGIRQTTQYRSFLVQHLLLNNPLLGHAETTHTAVALPKLNEIHKAQQSHPEPKIVPGEEWEKKRRELLAAEKNLLRQQDAVTKLRQEMPWEEVTKNYVFQRLDGTDVSLAALFREGKDDLIVYHFMFDPTWDEPCSFCSMWSDGYNGFLPFILDKVNFAVVAKAPPAKLKATADLKGWKFDFLSSGGSDFNHDFHVEKAEGEFKGYNYGSGWPWAATQYPGLSVLTKRNGKIFHTYSTYSRGLETSNSAWAIFDLLPFGRDGWGPKHRHQYEKQ